MSVHEFPEPFGTRREALVDLGLEEIDPERVGERLPQEGGFAGARRPEQEMTGLRRLEESTYKIHFCCRYGDKTTKTAAVSTRAFVLPDSGTDRLA